MDKEPPISLGRVLFFTLSFFVFIFLAKILIILLPIILLVLVGYGIFLFFKNGKSKVVYAHQEKENPLKGDGKNYFKIMGLAPHSFDDLTEEEIQQLVKWKYKFLSKKYHPDKGGEIIKMKTLNEAYRCLLDSETRNLYMKRV